MTILEILLPVFAIVLLGFTVVRFKLLSIGDINGVSRLVFNLLIPIFLFNSLAHVELPAQINWQFFLTYYCVMLLIYALGMWVSRRFFNYARREQGIFGMGSSYSNLVLVGLPIISAGFGEEALLPLFMLVSIHTGVQFFIVALVVEGQASGDGRSLRMALDSLRVIARNPIIIGLVLGLLANLLNLTFPAVLDETLDLISRATLPCALLVLGGSLNAHRLAGHFREAWTMIALKLIVQPFLVWLLAFYVFDLDPLWGTVAVMGAGMPVGINAFMAAQKYQAAIATTSTAFLLSTLLAAASQSLLLLFFM